MFHGFSTELLHHAAGSFLIGIVAGPKGDALVALGEDMGEVKGVRLGDFALSTDSERLPGPIAVLRELEHPVLTRMMGVG